MTSDAEYLAGVARTRRVRVSVRGICIDQGEILLKRSANDPGSYYAFIGGGLEYGEAMSDRLVTEYLEEFGLKVTRAEYLFVVENRFATDDGLFHGLEHFFQVDVESRVIHQREGHITADWIPLSELENLDVRPKVVRDAICDKSWRAAKHFAVPLISSRSDF